MRSKDPNEPWGNGKREEGMSGVFDPEDVLEEFPVRAKPPSMRTKIAAMAALYICVVSLAAYESREVVAPTVMAVAWQAEGLALGWENTMSREVLVFETYFSSYDPNDDSYDRRELAAKLRSCEGVSKVALSGVMRAHIHPGLETEGDGICVHFNDVSLPMRSRGTTIAVKRGRTIQNPNEVMISEYTYQILGRQIGEEVEFFGIGLRIVGISNVEAHSESHPIPYILLDHSHMDGVAQEMRRMAKEQGIPDSHEWFNAGFQLEVFARGDRNVDKVVDAIVELQDELSDK